MASKIFSRRLLGGDHAIIFYIALLKLLIHLFTNGGYGYNRDELYYLACADHLDWGYVDHPPLIGLIANFVRNTLGESLFAIRLLPALAGALMVFLTGLIVRQLSGKRFAQCLAALALIIAPIYLSMNTLFTTNAFDQLFWLTGLYTIILLLKNNNPRYWLVLGLVVGIGLLNKHTMGFFGFALIISLLITPQRRFLLTRWFWFGALIAIVLFLPNIIWQINHGWPTIEFLRKAVINRMAEISPLEFLRIQIFSQHPFTFPIWLAGIYYIFSRQGRRYRLVGWIYAVLFIIFALQRSKGYYLTPVYPVLWASGALLIERFIDKRNWKRLKSAILITMIIGGIIAAPFAVPVLPIDSLVKYGENLGLDFPPEYADMLGWEDMVATVAGIYHSLPPWEKSQCTIFANNYGQASAINFFGKNYDIPKAISTHNSYWLWGPGQYTGEIIITVGVRLQSFKQAFNDVELAATIKHDYVMWYETNQPVYIWRNPKLPLGEMWSKIKLFY